MTITNEPIAAGQDVKFIVKGFPDEDAVKASIERFYGLKPDAEKSFVVLNSFSELIMSGNVGGDGKIFSFLHHDRKESEKR